MPLKETIRRETEIEKPSTEKEETPEILSEETLQDYTTQTTEKIQKSAEEIISTGTGQLRELPESIGVGMYPENSLQTKEELSLVHEKLRSAKDKALHEIAAVMGAESSSERENRAYNLQSNEKKYIVKHKERVALEERIADSRTDAPIVLEEIEAFANSYELFHETIPELENRPFDAQTKTIVRDAVARHINRMFLDKK